MRINLMVTTRVVVLDMCELSRILESWHVPVKIPDPFVQSRIAASNITNVALEVLHINRVEPDDGCEEADVGFCDV